MRSVGFSRLTLGTLIFAIPVSLFGAFVSISNSGDGCGSSWPDCNGQIIPIGATAKTLIEYSHRVTSGIYGLMVLALCLWALRAFGKGHIVRKGAFWVGLLSLSEALIGAGLVKFHLVGDNDSVARAIVNSVHLVNTFFLLAALALTYAWSSGLGAMKWRGQGAVAWAVAASLLGAIVLGVSGAVSSLGNTLFPVNELGLRVQDMMSPTAHFLNRLRLLHPLLATSVGLLIVLLAGVIAHLRPNAEVRSLSRWVVGLYALQMLVGLTNIMLKAPTWMALTHLALAYLLWIVMIFCSGAALAVDSPRTEMAEEPAREPLQPGLTTAEAESVPLWKAYIALTKPRVISLLLFTTLAAMFIADGGWPGGWLLLAVAVGGYMMAGAANATNMVLDRDIDGRMKRTSKRPTVTAVIPTANALWFSAIMAAGSFALLAGVANMLAALLAFSGYAFYVVVYTILLKRRTWHNIVIGGAAGAFPPLVGYAAVNGQLSPFAWVLFAVIFFWTPVHFWALALLIKDDYAEAGVPMLPVVHGVRATVVQIVAYALLTSCISAIPFFLGEVRAAYLVGAILLNVVLVLRSFQLYRAPDRPHAVSLYKYSMLYLALLFVVIAVDRAWWM